jgi:RNA polymerase-binding protein DksA
MQEICRTNSFLREVRIMPTKTGSATKSSAKTSSKTEKALASSKVATKPPGKQSMAKKTTSGDSAVVAKKKKTAVKGPVQARTDLDIDHFRDLLLTERERYEAELEGIRSRSMDVEGSLPDEGESGDEDTADLAAAMMDKEIDLSVEDETMDLINAIDHALEKLEDGTYGICDISGEPIPKSRLELIPWASLTVACQAMSEGE